MKKSDINLPSSLPTMVSSELVKLPSQQQEIFLEEYSRRSKSIFVAYLLWLFLGLHYIYFKKWGTQLIFWLTSGGLFVWWLIDLLRIPGLVGDHNKTIAIQVMVEMKSVSK